jgi:hypothetical protein
MLKLSTNVFLKEIAFVRENEPCFGNLRIFYLLKWNLQN